MFSLTVFSICPILYTCGLFIVTCVEPFTLYWWSDHENSVKILNSYQNCWFIWSSSPHNVPFLASLLHVLGMTASLSIQASIASAPHHGFWMSDSLLRSLTPNWLTTFVLSSCLTHRFMWAQLFMWSSHQNRQRGPSRHSDTRQRCWR